MSNSSNAPSEEQIITVLNGKDLATHPFFQERQKLDAISGHDWLMILSMGLASATGARLLSLVLQLAGFPPALTLFSFILLMGLTLLTLKMRLRMPRLLTTVSFCTALGFILGFLA